MPKLTEEELALLTPAEREDNEGDDADEESQDDATGGEGAEGAGTTEGDGKDGTGDADAGADGSGKSTDTEDAGTDAGDGTAKEPANPAATATADDGATTDAAAAVEDEDFGYQPRPLPNWEAPSGAAERITAIETEKDDLANKFDEGEIDAKAYREQSRKLEQEQTSLKEALSRAEMRLDMQKTEWFEGAVPAFFKKHSEYMDGGPLNAALDHEVRKLQMSGEFQSQFDPRILSRAHSNVKAALAKLTGGTVTTEKKVEDQQPQQKKMERKPGKPAPTPNLASLPATDMTEETDGGEFAYLDRLTGVAFEKALAKLSDDQRDRYLAQ